eukprot:GHRR01018610.1.p2 GENE.GHRR01018610.1~~GHRR01018610.1.p2  ORF type:complete len:118 (-),score=9.78 GHRR01018610.1:1062-1415(-)
MHMYIPSTPTKTSSSIVSLVNANLTARATLQPYCRIVDGNCCKGHSIMHLGKRHHTLHAHVDALSTHVWTCNRRALSEFCFLSINSGQQGQICLIMYDSHSSPGIQVQCQYWYTHMQ